jgi:ATP-dependent RNA helicase RhlE
VHRIGRTARAGAAGVAISFCDAGEREYLRDIERLTKRPIAVTGGRPAQHAPAPAQPRPAQNHAGWRRDANRRFGPRWAARA